MLRRKRKRKKGNVANFWLSHVQWNVTLKYLWHQGEICRIKDSWDIIDAACSSSWGRFLISSAKVSIPPLVSNPHLFLRGSPFPTSRSPTPVVTFAVNDFPPVLRIYLVAGSRRSRCLQWVLLSRVRTHARTHAWLSLPFSSCYCHHVNARLLARIVIVIPWNLYNYYPRVICNYLGIKNILQFVGSVTVGWDSEFYVWKNSGITQRR